MKKILILAFLIIAFLAGPVFASNAQRKISTGRKTAGAQITTVPSTVYGIEIVATASNGYAVIFDSADSDLTDKKELVEINEAVQYNSRHASLGEDGIKAYNGIYLYLLNATAILYYY